MPLLYAKDDMMHACVEGITLMQSNGVIGRFPMQRPAEWEVHVNGQPSRLEGAGQSRDSVTVLRRR